MFLSFLQVIIFVYVHRETHVVPKKWRTNLANRVNKTLRILLMKWALHWEAPLFPDIKGLMVSLFFIQCLYYFSTILTPLKRFNGQSLKSKILHQRWKEWDCLQSVNLEKDHSFLLSSQKRTQDLEISLICLWLQSLPVGLNKHGLLHSRLTAWKAAQGQILHY